MRMPASPGREREGVDLSEVVLTHHTLKDPGKQAMPLGADENPKPGPITEAGSGGVQETQKALLAEIMLADFPLLDGADGSGRSDS